MALAIHSRSPSPVAKFTTSRAGGETLRRQATTERARAEADDLAHALDTPIAIISNEAGQIAGNSVPF